MIDSVIAGVAFSANPLNSDRDEMMVDSSWGLGESVVDGSVTADRYILDKIVFRVMEQTLGDKGNEKRLGEEGVTTLAIPDDDDRRRASSLTPDQLRQLTSLVCLVETTYGMPMDVEWAFVEADGVLAPRLLQARPITTLFALDEAMMTRPGEVRTLYFDCNVMSEATTTHPFTRMDLDFYCKTATSLCGVSFQQAETAGVKLFSDTDPRMPLYNGQTRQYLNMSWAFSLPFVTPDYVSKVGWCLSTAILSVAVLTTTPDLASMKCSIRMKTSFLGINSSLSI